MRKHLLVISFLLFSIQSFPQFGGNSTYDFLNIASSARVNALGSTQVGIIDSSELSLSFYNPALLMPASHNHLSANYIDFISDINIGFISYARHYDKIGTFAAGVQYINYGKFKEALENGTLTGNTFPEPVIFKKYMEKIHCGYQPETYLFFLRNIQLAWNSSRFGYLVY